MNREKVVNLAKEWLGKNEGDGSHRSIIDIYNNHKPLARGYKVKYTDAWCATTVSALAIKLGCTDIIPTECGCNPMIQLFKNIGEWVENDAYIPSPGDIIFYDWDDNGVGDCTGGSEHVGVVEYVSNGYITIIEGNKNDAVGRRKIPVNGKFIRGFGVPKYTVEIKKGWINRGWGWWYQESDGSYPHDKWEKIDGIWYYFDSKGYAVQNRWKWIDNKCYYFDANCHMISNAYIQSSNHPNFYHWVNEKGEWDSSQDSWDIQKYKHIEVQ